MTLLEPTARLGDLALETPARTRLFDQLHLDYCCGGQRSLAEACAQRGLDVDTVVALLAALDTDEPAARPDEHDIARASITELCDHLVEAHHEPLRHQLAHIGDLVTSVVRVHGMTEHHLHDLYRVFTAMRDELEAHLDLEETTLFPVCRALDESGTDVDLAVLDAHESDHAAVGDALAALRELSDGYRTDRALCRTHRLLMLALHRLELELHQHVHEENNALFPLVRARAAA